MSSTNYYIYVNNTGLFQLIDYISYTSSYNKSGPFNKLTDLGYYTGNDTYDSYLICDHGLLSSSSPMRGLWGDPLDPLAEMYHITNRINFSKKGTAPLISRADGSASSSWGVSRRGPGSYTISTDGTNVLLNGSSIISNRTRIYIELQAGGGGGGAPQWAWCGGSGGGGGAYASFYIALDKVTNKSVSVTVGSGGDYGSGTGGNAGTSGGDSSLTVNGITYTVYGGGRGVGPGAFDPPAGGSGGGFSSNIKTEDNTVPYLITTGVVIGSRFYGKSGGYGSGGGGVESKHSGASYIASDKLSGFGIGTDLSVLKSDLRGYGTVYNRRVAPYYGGGGGASALGIGYIPGPNRSATSESAANEDWNVSTAPVGYGAGGYGGSSPVAGWASSGRPGASGVLIIH